MNLKFLNSLLRLFRHKEIRSLYQILKNSGKPTPVIFPFELMEQAALLFLSGINNTFITQINPQWIWPVWIERQCNPKSNEFIPTGVNTLMLNLSLRNWTSIGIPHSSKEAIVDPVGMVTPLPWSASLFPYLKSDAGVFIPPRMAHKVDQNLEAAMYPSVITRYHAWDHLEWMTCTRALNIEGEECIEYTHILKNTSETQIDFTLGDTIRPYNPITISKIDSLHFKNNLWRVNHKAFLKVMTTPDHWGISKLSDFDPVLREETTLYQSKTQMSYQLLCGFHEYLVSLKPGEEKQFQSFFILNDSKTAILRRKFKHIHPDSIIAAQNTFYDYYDQNQERGLQLIFPDKSLENVFYALKNKCHIFDDIDHFSPGTFTYHYHWIRDSAFISQAFLNLNFISEVSEKIPSLMLKQTANGYFKSQEGEWDSNGQAIFIVYKTFTRSQDINILQNHYPELKQAVKWIAAMIRRKVNVPEIKGLLPAGLSAEHLGPNDFYFWDNLWSLYGIKLMIRIADILRKKSDKEYYQTLYDEYKTTLERVIIDRLHQNKEGVLSASPHRMPDAASISNLIVVTPLFLDLKNDLWLKETADFLYRNNVIQGMFYHNIIHTGFNCYLSLQLAKVFLLYGDPRWEEIMDASLGFASKTLTWPEAINPRSHGGCMGDGDHGWASAEMLNMIRDCFLIEQENILLLAAGISAFFNEIDHCLIQVINAPSDFGLVNYSIKPVTKNRLLFEWQITKNQFAEEFSVYFKIPYIQRLDPACELSTQIMAYFNHTIIKCHTNSGSLFLDYMEGNECQINFD